MCNTLFYKENDRIGTIFINRPDALNALNSHVFTDLYSLLDKLDNDYRIRVIILTGHGVKAFAAGSDIKEMENLSPFEARRFASKARKAVDKIESVNKPVIGEINGFALGGGCELALACDLRIASEKAKFGQPEINLGLIPGSGGTQRLARLIGPARAKEMVFSGEVIDAGTAYDYGLINKVVPHKFLMEEAYKMARKLADKSGIMLSLIKSSFNAGRNMDLSSALEFEIQCFAECFATEDRREGFTAFSEKRKPNFIDK
jgi:enoyl-CoA hydratase